MQQITWFLKLNLWISVQADIQEQQSHKNQLSLKMETETWTGSKKQGKPTFGQIV